jgi:hypothetical protein
MLWRNKYWTIVQNKRKDHLASSHYRESMLMKCFHSLLVYKNYRKKKNLQKSKYITLSRFITYHQKPTIFFPLSNHKKTSLTSIMIHNLFIGLIWCGQKSSMFYWKKTTSINKSNTCKTGL